MLQSASEGPRSASTSGPGLRRLLVVMAVSATLLLVPALAFASGTVTGVVSGTISDLNGAGLAGACVRVTDGSSDFVSSPTDGTGAYSIGSLPNGRYHLRVSDCGPSTHIAHWYNGGSGALQETGASAISVGAGTLTVNEKLLAGGSVSGTLTFAGPSGTAPVAGGMARLVGDGGVITAGTDAQGAYTIAGIPTGKYKLSFFALHFTPSFYNGAANEGSAALLTRRTQPAVATPHNPRCC